jgi:ppGpp synthetase/RelA/SpoT-type nucleotidyltranferase
MPRNDRRIEDLYDLQMKDWKKSLHSISRKLSRRLDGAGLKYSLKHRVKKIGSLREKQRRQPLEGTRRKERIKDLLGVRVVVPFQEDVEKVVEVVERQFDVLEIERKAEHLSFREFAYDSVHVVIDVPNVKTLEFPPGCSKACEVQVRTILQDAWAEVEHELIYKSDLDFPDTSVRKKLAALNASLALSDTIFQEIRDYQRELSEWGRERFHELRKKAALPEPMAIPRAKKNSETAEAGQRRGKCDGDARLDSTLYLGLKAHNEKNYAAAIQLYSRALKMRPSGKIRSIIYNHRGMASFMLQRGREALRDFDRSFQCDPRNCRALNNRALIWRRLGHVQESLQDFSRSLEIKGRQPEVHFMRSQSFLEIGDLASALRDVEAALALRRAYPEAEELRDRIREIRSAARG